MNTKAHPPVIIIGMHRSGTSMITRMLEMLGLFMGYRKELNHEAFFFLKLNEWMLRQANASWDNPYNFNFINGSIKNEMVRVLYLHLKGLRRLEYLGFKKFLNYKDIRDLDFPWGWKDPRNTFTIDIWKEIFPDAKILHIYRDPIDVAESLRKREVEIKKEFKRNWKKTVKKLLLVGKVGYQSSVRVQNIYEGIKLWQEYIDKAFSLNDEFKRNILHIRYETFLENPEENFKYILEFIDLYADKSAILTLANNIHSDRKFAFAKKGDLIEVYNQTKDKSVMKELNYHNII